VNKPILFNNQFFFYYCDVRKFDVIIVGAGPAGLQCAKVLGDSGKSVLILEKDGVVGDKVCAGGLTRKELEVIKIPDELIEHKVNKTSVNSSKRKSQTEAQQAFVFTVNRLKLGEWQKEQLHPENVEALLNSKVTEVFIDKVIVNKRDEYGFDFLVGADGYKSVVRRYLDLPVEKKLIGIQYTIPLDKFEPELQIHLHSKYFGSWYAWNFPHKNSIAVGCCCDASMLSSKKLKDNFHMWLKEKGFDISGAKYESSPISYDYRGLRFDHMFLVGDAGGFASGFTGEGIYQALVSGETAAKLILDENHDLLALNAVIKYNHIQYKIMKFLSRAGRFRGMIHELIVILLNNKWVKGKIRNGFS